ncbi:hypothetical protein CTAYLR_003356 [Chrysophaeum taylorii]|uniref:ATP-grasp domain-containing protein n=1 Tax=Chrysophaeum taylorii TaxID=2483200 RepID=A0AAD7UEM0_9STRA|nr:hypothetical protein CTAYLR_003356 [Chrysophaeum taylorii]
MEGFTPLRKALSEPANARASRSRVYRGPDYVAARLQSIASRLERDGCGSWKPVEKVASFTKRSSIDEESRVVVVVDPFSTGALLAVRAVELGYGVVRVLSDGDSPVASLVADGACVDYEATIVVPGDTEAAYDAAAKALTTLPYAIVALFAGAETGVTAADELGARLGLRGNGNDPTLSKARRNKYLMGEVVRAAGVRAVAQRVVKSWADARLFLEDLVEKKKNKKKKKKKNSDDDDDDDDDDAFPVVVKPVESAGSDDVFKCASAAEVKCAVEMINGKVNGLGSVNEGALVQEFLRGTEYVVDSVSLDGVHKVVAIWKYDKRAANGATFCYHGMSLVDVAGGKKEEKRVGELLVAYSRKVLDALGIANGPSHQEIMFDGDSACLVEVGARCHGGEGSWAPIAKECAGCDQIDATLAAHLDDSRFAKLPKTPEPLKKYGAEIFFVTRVSGMVRSTAPATKKIQQLASFAKLEWQLKAGDFAPLTVDCFTRPGSAQLVHQDRAQLEADCRAIRELESPRAVPPLLDLEYVCRAPIETGTVVVVDPYSTGAILAARVRAMHRKKLVVVHSDPTSPIAHLVASGTNLQPHAVVVHRGDVAATAAEISANSRAIVAVVPGAETGVLLAEQLGSHLGTRVNPPDLCAARRNKYLMGEAVRAAGVRAVAQAKVSTRDEARAFVKRLLLLLLQEEEEEEEDERAAAQHRRAPASIFPLVVKPVESAGSDDVFKCDSADEVFRAVEVISGKVNGLGFVNEGALVQEYLRGTEYVVDAVSRDGVHKVVAIWRYDKRPVNGANFVYFGMALVDFHDQKDSAVAKILAEYSAQVCDALHIRDGPSHMEVKLDPQTRRPCLVEVGARCHGGEATWLPVADACVGYNQVDAALDAVIDADAFDALPVVPNPFKNYGREYYMVSRQRGVVKALHVDKITALKSFAKMELAVQPGSKLAPTIDCFTRPGAIQLVHPDPAVVEADYRAIRALEEESRLFELHHE